MPKMHYTTENPSQRFQIKNFLNVITFIDIPKSNYRRV